MKKNLFSIIMIGLSVVMAGICPAAAADDVSALQGKEKQIKEAMVPEIETLNLDSQEKHPEISDLPANKKSVAGFLHKKHAFEYVVGTSKYSKFNFDDSFTCKACHHKAENPSEAGSCFTCKDLGPMFDSVGGTGKMQELFHRTCKACHKSMADAGKNTGPTSCKGCHGQ